MSFDLEPAPSVPDEPILQLAVLDLSSDGKMPDHGHYVDAPPRIRKAQIYCRRCRRDVEETQQTGLQCGRRIIVCTFLCHGDRGEIRICQDQLSSQMRFEVFDGLPALMPHPEPKRPALPDSKPVEAPRPKRRDVSEVIDIEAEVIEPIAKAPKLCINDRNLAC